MKFFVNALVVLLVLGLVGVAFGQEKKKDAPKEKPVVTGKFVSATDKEITLAVKKEKEGAAQEVKVSFDDKTAVKVDGKEAKVADIKPGMHVAVWGPAGGPAVRITAAGANKEGGHKEGGAKDGAPKKEGDKKH